MSKNEKEAASAADSKQGSAIVLPNGVRRIDFIRDNFYGKKSDHTNPELKGKRGAIRTAINDMLKEAGRETEQIPYQIVFAGTKDKENDPRDKPAAVAGTTDDGSVKAKE